jgi:hypothetical protein
METPREHHGREYIIGGIGAFAEYLAVRYDVTWLAWLAALLFWLAVIEYTRHSAWIKPRWKIAICGGLLVVIGLATFFLTRNRTVPEVAKIPEPSPSQVKTRPKDKDDHGQTAPVQKPKSKQPEPQTKIEQHGNGSGAVGGNLTQGPCSIAQLGGDNNQASVNCTPQVPTISSITIEAKVWCDLIEGMKRPLATQMPFMGLDTPVPMLTGSGQQVLLALRSPFLLTDAGERQLTVTEKFGLPSDSPWLGKPVESLSFVDTITVQLAEWPFGIGTDPTWCGQLRSMSFVVSVNGKPIFSTSGPLHEMHTRGTAPGTTGSVAKVWQEALKLATD